MWSGRGGGGEEGEYRRKRGRGSNVLNTRESVSLGYPNTKKRVKNTTRSGEFLKEFEVLDISAQSKQKVRSLRRNKIVKIDAN